MTSPSMNESPESVAMSSETQTPATRMNSVPPTPCDKCGSLDAGAKAWCDRPGCERMVVAVEPMSLRAAAAAFLKTWDSVHTGAAAAVVRARILDLRCALSQPDAAAVGDSGAVAMSSETQTPSPDAAREAFERVHAGAAKVRNSTTGEYVYPSVADAWAGWDACWREKYHAALSHPSPDVRDAERMDWLAAHVGSAIFHPPTRDYLLWTIYLHTDTEYVQATGDTFRRAIDTAIAKEKLGE